MVYSTKRFAFSLALYYFIVASFSPFSIANTSFGKERANLCAFRTFVRLALVWFCLFPLHFCGWDGLGLLLELLLYHVAAVKSLFIHHHIVWPQTLSLFFFSLFFSSFFFFFCFFRGHNTCMACRIFVYFSPLARRKVFCSAIDNLKLDKRGS